MPVDERSPQNKADPNKRANARPRNPPAEPSVPTPEPEPVAPTVAAAPAAAPVPEVRETPRPDALQLMQEGLARCATGSIVDRMYCDQRVRREYCDGRWGQVPQCPIGGANERGQ
jgi:hypothetical protein